MNQKVRQTSSLKPNELEAVYAISTVVAQTEDIDEALNEITKTSRDVIIFDSAVVYLRNESEASIEPIFARAIGRGRSSEAELVWGDKAAKETIETGSIYLWESEIDPQGNRLDQYSFLSLPMIVGGNITGALVLIRFGGPTFTDDQINLAQFITTHASQLFERQRLVEKIANLEAEKRLARMQDDFIAMVSHELKTPLGFIKGYTSTLLRKDTEWDEETRKEFLAIIDEEADMLSELIVNLLDSSRLKSGSLQMEIQHIQLDQFFKEIMERLIITDIGLDIQVNITPDHLSMMGDPKRLSQVINNLINNANKYAPNSTLKISASPKDKGVQISITDNGPGIPPKHLEHIFKRFYRVPERSAGVRGTGLGLYICDQIIRAHNGSIDVQSTINKGTTFNIYLPPA